MIQVAGGILLALVVIIGFIVGFPVLVLFIFTHWYIILVGAGFAVIYAAAHMYESWRYERAMRKWREANGLK